MDNCTNCYYKIYCQKAYKFYNVNPCNITSDKQDLIKIIEDITADLRAQYIDD